MRSKKKIPLEVAQKVIPRGFYCYKHSEALTGSTDGRRRLVGLCPYWSIRKGKPEQLNGYCSFLQKGDWMENGTSLLFDMCKECGVNAPTCEDLEKEWGE